MKSITKLEAKIARLEIALQDLKDSMPISNEVTTTETNEVLPESKGNQIEGR